MFSATRSKIPNLSPAPRGCVPCWHSGKLHAQEGLLGSLQGPGRCGGQARLLLVGTEQLQPQALHREARPHEDDSIS